jgi:membrane fusion protein (multidrug efflux system)
MSQHQSVLIIDKAVPTAEMAAEPAQNGQIHALRAPEVTPRITEQAPKRRAGKWPGRKGLLIGASLLALTGATQLGWQYWTTGRFEVSTDDAYVKADSTTIAPKIAGYLAQVLVDDNEPVKAGQVLARIDDRDFRVALEQARADVEAATASITNEQAELAVQQSIIDAAQATVVADQANQTFAEQDDRRYADLAIKGFGSVQNAQLATARITAARAAVARDTAALATAIKRVDVLKAGLAQAQAALSRARAVQDQAELNLSYTTIVSPMDGVVANRTLRVGQYVQAGTQLMAVVPTQVAYIIANYKETQLTNVHPGQSVEVAVDMFPGQVFHGRVDSLSPASGQEFALLPPDNATGNFTKVVQRIPVKITLDPSGPLVVVLRPGMSAYPTIHTKAEALRGASTPAHQV